MTKDQLYSLLSDNKIDKVKEVFELNYDIDVIKKALKQYKVSGHDVLDPIIRPGKPIEDEQGNLKSYAPTNRIAAPYQKQIVLLRSAFIGSPKMASNPQEDLQQDLVTVMTKIWEDNKLDYRFNETTKRTMSELKCAWLFYNTEDIEYWKDQPIISTVKPKVRLLSYELGDLLYPVFDINDDLIAFGREYTSSALDDDFNKVEVTHLDIYTDERIYFKKRVKEQGWIDNFPEEDKIFIRDGEFKYKPNLTGKIPVIYFQQTAPEWDEVQTAIDRIEKLASNHADTNDANAWPILFGKGTTITLPEASETAKYIEGTGDADLKYVTWDNAPESVKLEKENLESLINDLTNTVSHKDFKDLGQSSGFAIQLRFLLPTLRARDSQMTIFAEGVQRAYNYMKKLISVLDKKYVATLSFPISPEFASVLPSNVTELLNNIAMARSAGNLSQETAIEINPLVPDAEIEKQRLKDETTAINESPTGLDAEMNAA